MKAISYLLVTGGIIGLTWLALNRGNLDDSRGGNVSTAGYIVRQAMVRPFESFRNDVGRYPTADEGLAALLFCPASLTKSWKGPYIDAEKLPLDPWRREYRYRSPGIRSHCGYDLWSLGADGVESADDIGNWEK
ncbi:type II secretion system protein GspG [Nibricoccus aquaticus]|uniref:Type II secretion system protein GspG n=1 Tax=Nibricoccus aquaticus TaxID=2576891 RepID=A0A290QLS8_9BACT|nr:type II secretion system protein GspG [Nibricoccus aquaticus]ATC65451.1 type II secretion system protein GspG [Nibricoccus aquaticus]